MLRRFKGVAYWQEKQDWCTDWLTNWLTDGRVKNIIPSATGCMGYNYAYSYLINMQTAFFIHKF